MLFNIFLATYQIYEKKYPRKKAPILRPINTATSSSVIMLFGSHFVAEETESKTYAHRAYVRYHHDIKYGFTHCLIPPLRALNRLAG